MKPVAEINRENLEKLIKEAGTLEALATRGEWENSVYLNQVRRQAIDTKSGSPRNMGPRTARKLEKAMGKPRGWMDQDHSHVLISEDKPGDARAAFSIAIRHQLALVPEAELGAAMAAVLEVLERFCKRGAPE